MHSFGQVSLVLVTKSGRHVTDCVPLQTLSPGIFPSHPGAAPIALPVSTSSDVAFGAAASSDADSFEPLSAAEPRTSPHPLDEQAPTAIASARVRTIDN